MTYFTGVFSLLACTMLGMGATLIATGDPWMAVPVVVASVLSATIATRFAVARVDVVNGAEIRVVNVLKTVTIEASDCVGIQLPPISVEAIRTRLILSDGSEVPLDAIMRMKRPDASLEQGLIREVTRLANLLNVPVIET